MSTIRDLVCARAADTSVGMRFEDSAWTWTEIVEAAARRAAFFRAHAPSDAPFHVGVLEQMQEIEAGHRVERAVAER